MSGCVARNHFSTFGKTLALLLAAAGLSACAAAAAGPVIGHVAGSAVSKSSDVLQAGKGETHQPVSFDDMVAITRRTAAELDLKLVGEEKQAGKLKLAYEDLRHQKIDLTLVQRTHAATQVRVDVGWFGDSGMGELLLRQILRNVPNVEKAPPTAAVAESEELPGGE